MHKSDRALALEKALIDTYSKYLQHHDRDHVDINKHRCMSGHRAVEARFRIYRRHRQKFKFAFGTFRFSGWFT